MDKLSKQQHESLRKLDTDRLRARLVKAGAEEELVFTSEREALLEMMADIMPVSYTHLTLPTILRV